MFYRTQYNSVGLRGLTKVSDNSFLIVHNETDVQGQMCEEAKRLGKSFITLVKDYGCIFIVENHPFKQLILGSVKR